MSCENCKKRRELFVEAIINRDASSAISNLGKGLVEMISGKVEKPEVDETPKPEKPPKSRSKKV